MKKSFNKYLLLFLVSICIVLSFQDFKVLAVTEENKIDARGNISVGQAVSNIYLGNGTIEDYVALGLNSVTANNLLWINAEVHDRVNLNIAEEKINERKKSIINAVNSAINDYPIVKNINDGNITKDVNGNGREYYHLNSYYIKYGEDKLIQKAISIEKDLKARDLTKRELINNINKVRESKDSKYIVTTIRKELDLAKSQKGDILTKEEVQKVIDDTTSKINNCYEKIVRGNGELDDYLFIQITGVNKDNIVWVNAEIKENIDIKLIIENKDGKINNVQQSLNKIFEFYQIVKNINDGNITKDVNGNGREYYHLNSYYIKYESDDLIQKSISIEKDLKVRDLTKRELINNINKVRGSKDSKYRIIPIRDAIDNAVTKKERKLTSREVSVIINYYSFEIDKSYEKIVKGEAGLKDYQLIQISGVNKDNIVWVNAEIKENIDIKLVIEDKDGKINNVQESLNKILQFYPIVKNINDGKITKDINGNGGEYYGLNSYYIKYGEDKLIQKAISIGKELKIRDLTKRELIDTINQVRGSKDSKYVVITIRNALDLAKLNKGSALREDEVQKVIDDTKKAIDICYEKIVKGEAELKDYQFIQITGVNKDNIVWVNAEIKENIDIKLKIEQVDGKINNVQQSLNNMFNSCWMVKNINDGNLTRDINGNGREYYYLNGYWIKYGTDQLIQKKIKEEKALKGRDLTKRELINIVNKYK